MNPFIIRAGCVIAVAVVYAVWSYSWRQPSRCFRGNPPQRGKSNKKRSPKFDGNATVTCPICYDSLAIFNDNANVTLPCKHKYHLNCIKLMHKNGGLTNCPVCRRNVSKEFVLDLLKKDAYNGGCFN